MRNFSQGITPLHKRFSRKWKTGEIFIDKHKLSHPTYIKKPMQCET